MSDDDLRHIRNILTMNDEVRTSLIYEQGAYLKKKIIGQCKRCDGSGTRYVEVGGSYKSYPCICYREYVYKLDLLIAGVGENTATSILNTYLQDTRVVEVDITVKREPGQDFPRERRGYVYKDNLNRYMRRTEYVVTNGFSYLFTGHNGTGKTFAALQVLHNYLRKGYSGHYILFRELMRHVNKWLTGDKDARKEAEKLVREIFDVDLLVIDELGKEGGGREHVSSELDSMLKERDQRSKPTILITNHQCEELIDRYTSQTSDFTSVLMKSYRVLHFNPRKDFRKVTRKRWQI